LREDVAKITATMAAGLRTARDRVQDAAESADAKDKLARVHVAPKARLGAPAPGLGDAEQNLERAVRQHPLISLLIAGLIGFLLGSLGRR
jgi:ElaB/YqjD/DUF883 family membrane-anchored ribosome-binding protein